MILLHGMKSVAVADWIVGWFFLSTGALTASRMTNRNQKRPDRCNVLLHGVTALIALQKRSLQAADMCFDDLFCCEEP